MLLRFYDEARRILDLVKDTKTSASSQFYGEDIEQVDDLLKTVSSPLKMPMIHNANLGMMNTNTFVLLKLLKRKLKPTYPF